MEWVTRPDGEARPKRTSRVIAVMPAYNAERTLAADAGRHAARLRRRSRSVDDGSTDRTVEIARDMGLTVIVHEQTRATAATRRRATTKRSSAAPTSW